MNTALWIVQILLVLMFGIVGFLKLTQPKEKLAKGVRWVDDFAPPVIRTIGLVEILGVLGLILPPLTGILPVLTILAAVGFVLDMIVAALVHLRLREYGFIAVNLVLLLLATFVAYGRWRVVPL